jgi:hypothetical protein
MLPFTRADFEYVEAGGDSPYRDWFEGLNAQAAAKVTVVRMFGPKGNPRAEAWK